jgi:hypothetical protein
MPGCLHGLKAVSVGHSSRLRAQASRCCFWSSAQVRYELIELHKHISVANTDNAICTPGRGPTIAGQHYWDDLLLQQQDLLHELVAHRYVLNLQMYRVCGLFISSGQSLSKARALAHGVTDVPRTRAAHETDMNCRASAAVHRLVMPGKSGTACPRVCRVEGCGRALTGLRTYFKRVRICPEHHAADEIATSNGMQRFCQKCGRLQPLEAFDGSRRSCARKLQVHNLNLKRKRGPLVS